MSGFMKQISTIQHSRRTVLRGISAAGLAGGLGTGIGSAQPDETLNGSGNDRSNEAAGNESRPSHKEFECPEGMEHLGTFEFVTLEDEEGTVIDCYFEQSEGEIYPITITGYESKDGEDCEPITVTYESETHTVERVASFGGTDTHVDEEPDGLYESDLETEGGQQAAISLIHFCGTETEDSRTDVDGETN